MRDDPVVMEVPRIREQHAACFDYDLKRIADDFKESEKNRDAGKSPLLVPPDRARMAV